MIGELARIRGTIIDGLIERKAELAHVEHPIERASLNTDFVNSVTSLELREWLRMSQKQIVFRPAFLSKDMLSSYASLKGIGSLRLTGVQLNLVYTENGAIQDTLDLLMRVNSTNQFMVSVYRERLEELWRIGQDRKLITYFGNLTKTELLDQMIRQLK